MRDITSPLNGFASPFPKVSSAGLQVVGSWINTAALAAPSWDFTSIPFQAGDLLVAMFADDNSGNNGGGLSGFSASFLNTAAAPSMGIYTKVAVGTETTYAISNIRSAQVATMAIRGGSFGSAAFNRGSLNAPAITNAAGDTVFCLFTGKEVTATPPSGYTSIQADQADKMYINLAVKEGAGANEDPASWTGTLATSGIITFNFTPT